MIKKEWKLATIFQRFIRHKWVCNRHLVFSFLLVRLVIQTAGTQSKSLLAEIGPMECISINWDHFPHINLSYEMSWANQPTHHLFGWWHTLENIKSFLFEPGSVIRMRNVDKFISTLTVVLSKEKGHSVTKWHRKMSQWRSGRPFCYIHLPYCFKKHHWFARFILLE